MKNFFCALTTVLVATLSARAQGFDGSKWNVSTGNLSTYFIQHSPIGAFPQENFFEPPPSAESLTKLKQAGLIADEDYIAWGAVERQEGKWDWKQHDAVEQAMHKAGLKYVAYNWVHFPPVWLRESGRCTLMKCLEHGQETNYLSIFDPKTLEYYDHFYKALAEHFGDKIDGVYACILGPYGEGNYPLDVHDWVKIGHCHEGYWCGDKFAIAAFADAMKKKYREVGALNAAWGAELKSFEEVRPPREIDGKWKPSPEEFKTAQDRRRWLDFIAWYHQAIIDFAEGSIRVTLKYFPKEKVRVKPGGTAAGVNPIAWGTYCPGYAKMAGKYGVVLQPADCQGAVFGDKWVGTAYQFYHVPLGTEPAGNLDRNSFVRRMFSDASAGASQFFTYEFEQHAEDMRKYVHLYTGAPGETEIAVFCPTTLYRLGGDLRRTISLSAHLRDLCDFDVLDEQLIADGALNNRYKVLIVFQPDYVDQPILDKITSWVRAGGAIFSDAGGRSFTSIEGERWPLMFSKARNSGAGHVIVRDIDGGRDLRDMLAPSASLKGYDGQLDGLWTTRRGGQTFILNTKDKPVTDPQAGVIAPHAIWESK